MITTLVTKSSNPLYFYHPSCHLPSCLAPIGFSIVNARADIYIFVHCIIRHKHSSLFDIYLGVELLGYRVNISLVELPKCLVLVTIFSSTNIVSILIAQFFASLLLFFVVVLFVFISHLVKIFAFTNFSYF